MKIRVYDTSKAKDIRKLYAKAVAEGANFIIGPLSKNNVKTLSRRGDISVPTLALNYTKAGYNPPAKLFEFGISPLNEAVQVANRAYKKGLTKALVIAPDSAWGQNIASAFGESFSGLNGKVIATLNYKPNENLRQAVRHVLDVDQSEARGQAIEKTLGEDVTFVPQRRKDIDMIFIVARPNVARTILPLLRFYYAGNLPIYSISMIYKGIEKPSYYRDMNNVVYPDIPWIYNSSEPKAIQSKLSTLWPKRYNNYIRLYALGLDAYMLTKDFKNIPNAPSSNFQGRTGELFLGQNHWIVQSFSWAKFNSGKAKLVS